MEMVLIKWARRNLQERKSLLAAKAFAANTSSYPHLINKIMLQLYANIFAFVD